MIMAIVVMPTGAAVITCVVAWLILRKLVRRRLALKLAVLAAVVAAAAALCWGTGRARMMSRRMCCQSTLHQLDSALSDQCRPPNTAYPAKLSDLTSKAITPHMLLCPALIFSGASAAPTMADAAETTTYIYIAHPSTSIAADMPIILCPPIYHEDEGGNVLLGDHSTTWVPKAQFDNLIEKLYADTNLTIVVSEALTKRSKGKYYSRP